MNWSLQAAAEAFVAFILPHVIGFFAFVATRWFKHGHRLLAFAVFTGIAAVIYGILLHQVLDELNRSDLSSVATTAIVAYGFGIGIGSALAFVLHFELDRASLARTIMATVSGVVAGCALLLVIETLNTSNLHLMALVALSTFIIALALQCHISTAVGMIMAVLYGPFLIWPEMGQGVVGLPALQIVLIVPAAAGATLGYLVWWIVDHFRLGAGSKS